jgi:hypothetical protein
MVEKGSGAPAVNTPFTMGTKGTKGTKDTKAVHRVHPDSWRPSWALAMVLVVLHTLPGTSALGQTPGDKVPIVAVSGCLTERKPNTWTLTNATEPTPSTANAPSAKAPVEGPATGKQEFVLVGTSEFGLSSHRGHTVLVKALLIEATPLSRLNVTSVTHIAPTCPPSAK